MWGVDEVLSACIIGTVMATSRARVPQTHGNDKGLLRSASGNWQSTSLLRVRRCTNDWPVHAKAGTWAPSSGCLQPEAACLPTELSYLLGCAQEVLWRSALTRRSGFGSVQNLAGCVVCSPRIRASRANLIPAFLFMCLCVCPLDIPSLPQVLGSELCWIFGP